MFIFDGSFFDERFVLHRLKATRFATVVTSLMMAAYILYEFYSNDVVRLDLIGFLAILATAKIGAMIFYRVRG